MEQALATKEEKIAAAAALTERLESAPMSIVAGYSRLSVGDMQQLRRRMREAGATFRVIKNSIARRAVVGAGFGDIEPQFFGQTAIAFSGEDYFGAARALREFGSRFPDLQIRGAIVEGTVVDAAQVHRLASLLSVDQLRAEFVGALEAPISGLVYSLESIVSGLVYALQGRVDQMQEAVG